MERALALNEAREVLTKVGLADRLTHRPKALSGGERQRAAVARALVTRPSLVLADEPTGNLDRANAERVFECLLDLNRYFEAALVIVTHDESLAARLMHTYRLESGRLETKRT
jgi:lipoprotein-releasing system ATP-binding protein